MTLQKPTSNRDSKRKYKEPVLFSCAFDNTAHVRSKCSLFLWSKAFLKLLESHRKQLSYSPSFGNRKKRLEFSLPLRYTTKNVTIKSIKCTFRLDSRKRNYRLIAVVHWSSYRSYSILPIVGRYFYMQLVPRSFEQSHYLTACINPRTGTTEDLQSSVSIRLAEVVEK